LEEHQALPYLRETLLFLALAGILIPILKRLKVNQVVGFLCAGMLVGPYGLGLMAQHFPELSYFVFPNTEGIRPLAELGVLFLMFMIGLELSVERLRALYKWVFGAGLMQVLLSTAVIGVFAWIFGNTLEKAFVLGLVLSLSSTAVVMQLLNEQRTLDSPLGRASFSILMFQDLAVVPIFILLDVLAEGRSDNLLPLIGMTLAKSIGTIVLIYFLGRRFIRPFFRSFAGQNQPDVFMALTLLCSLGIAGLTAAAGLSLALGAFLAGLLISETEFRHEVEIAIEPFRGLLMGLFFMLVGMQIDWREIIKEPILIPISVIGLFLIKGTVIALILRVCKFRWSQAIQGGLLLGQGGEFAFIVIGTAVSSALLANDVGQFMMLVVSLSLFITPMAAKAGKILSERKGKKETEQDGRLQSEFSRHRAPHVIIAGFGRVGQLLARLLSEQGVDFIAFDNDLGVVMQESAKGRSVYLGNASNTAIWEKLRAGQAKAVILTMDHPGAALHAVNAVRHAYPSLPILARAIDENQAAILKYSGANMVIPETLETGLQLASSALQMSGISEPDALEAINHERSRLLAAVDYVPQ
jgi:monovalent cation:H+ antiporter-2, CPA2 family